MKKNTQQALDSALKGPSFERRIRFRNLKDRILSVGISFGGVAVIAAVLLIMFFLVYVVVPLFSTASMAKINQYAVPGSAQDKTIHYTLDEYQETAMRYTISGGLYGFNVQTGEILSKGSLPLNGANITSFSIIDEANHLMAFGLSNGSMIVAQYTYRVTFPDNIRKITPEVIFPFGKNQIELGSNPLDKLTVRSKGSDLVVAFLEKDSTQVNIKRFIKERSLFGDSVTLSEDVSGSFEQKTEVDYLLLDGGTRNLYVVSKDGTASYYNVANVESPQLLQHLNLIQNGDKISTMRFLLGDYSLMIGTEKGYVYQWFPVRNEHGIFQLQFVREFKESDAPIEMIAIEHARRGFATISQGQFDLFHSTAERHLINKEVDSKGLNFVTFSPRANSILLETGSGNMVFYGIDNAHPDVSMNTLWGKVWYEGYEEPSYTWQSSAASADFEPKMSMMPLTYGTIKAAMYSMLFAVPIAILAAIYTAFFMDTKTRQWIKPSVELIEALPTVILGFLAGLWLAPFMESNLSGFFALLIVVPLGTLLFGFLWSRLPDVIRLSVSEGRRAVLMLPVIALLGYFALSMANPIENTFFNGDMRHWLTFNAGIDFDQRNAMVIGFAMGFALIPTIFSVAEDAIYNVPSYLVNGSLALGASTWQTMVGVVLPTASPGIFSAIMLGFGRGIGETMIVLMASGNTPLMEVNIFEGMRTLSANLAVEMAETAMYSTHYRVLFLSGLVLFIFTFIFNTLAEVVRERMRRRYGSL